MIADRFTTAIVFLENAGIDELDFAVRSFPQLRPRCGQGLH
jgi:hypothetical protein